MPVDRITIRKPDDWHLHVRDGAMLKAALPYTARHFGRAIIMPNLLPPVCTVKEAEGYRGRIVNALPPGAKFEPLMTCYMTHETAPDEVEAGFKAGDVLVQFGDKPIHNLYDFTDALRRSKVGDVVEVQVLRDGKPITAKVTLEQRR